MVDVVYVLLTVVGLVPLYADLIIRIRKGHVEFELERFEDKSQHPVDSEWSIRILHPNRIIERCAVLFGDKSLPLWDKNEPYYERKIPVGGGANFRIPKNIQKDDSEVVVKDGKKKLTKRKFSEISVGN